MKIITPLVALLCICLFSIETKAITYITAQSGKFSSSSTWIGGVVPPANIGTNKIYITNGATVELDVNVTIGSFSTLRVISGNLIDSGMHTISIYNPDSLYVYNGIIYSDSMYLSGGNYMMPQSTIMANKMTFAGANISGPVFVRPIEKVEFNYVNSYVASGDFNWAGADTIQREMIFNGGTFSHGANFSNNSTKSCTIKYIDTINTIGGFELLGKVPVDIQILIAPSSRIKLAQDVIITRDLLIADGMLDLNGHHLTIDRDATVGLAASSPHGSGRFIGSTTSGITWKTSASMSQIKFEPGKDTLGKFEINTFAPTNKIKIHPQGAHLTVTDSLILTTGIFEGNIVVAPHAITLGGSSNSYVIGELTAEVPAYGSYMYHIGNGQNYTPARMLSYSKDIVNITASATQDDTPIEYNPPFALPTVNNLWTFDPAYVATDMNIELFWHSNMEVNSFNRGNTTVVERVTSSSGPSDTYLSGLPVKRSPNGTFSVTREHALQMPRYMAIVDSNYRLSVNEINSSNNGFTIYPNPATEKIHIANSEHSTVAVTIQDITGKTVKTATLEQGDNIIDVNDLVSGMYMVTFKNTNMQTTKKFVKQ